MTPGTAPGDPEGGSALERWGEQLLAWGIPDEILAAAPESPWGFPTELFRRRTEATLALEPSPSARRAREALPEGGTVLDVGVGAGAACLPLADRASLLVGVDSSDAMLEAFREAAAARGTAVETVLGTWPDVAPQVAPADVAVCHHVFYNAADLGPFALALTECARHRVVAELTVRHPLAWMNDLWERLHGLRRPEGPTADDAVAALRELGLVVHREDHLQPPVPSGFEHREEAVALVRRRLCLTPDRDAEIAESLGDRLVQREGLWSAGARDHVVVTLWWEGTA